VTRRYLGLSWVDLIVLIVVAVCPAALRAFTSAPFDAGSASLRGPQWHRFAARDGHEQCTDVKHTASAAKYYLLEI